MNYFPESDLNRNFLEQILKAKILSGNKFNLFFSIDIQIFLMSI